MIFYAKTYIASNLYIYIINKCRITEYRFCSVQKMLIFCDILVFVHNNLRAATTYAINAL